MRGAAIVQVIAQFFKPKSQKWLLGMDSSRGGGRGDTASDAAEKAADDEESSANTKTAPLDVKKGALDALAASHSHKLIQGAESRSLDGSAA